jgi:2'-5' RNA ligase
MNRHSRPPATHFEWFFTIRPPLDVATLVWNLGRGILDRHGLQGALRPLENLHISLPSIGAGPTIPADRIHQACEVAERTSLLAPPFEVGFGRTANFGRPADDRPVVLTQQKGENAELMILHRMLGLGLRKSKIPAALSFIPHVTMFYGEEAPEVSVERISWRVEEFELVCSHYGQSKYETLGRWKLIGEAFPPGILFAAHSKRSDPRQMEFGL